MKTKNLWPGLQSGWLAAACAGLLAGCSFAPKYAPPVVPAPTAFKELTPEQSQATDGWKTAEPKDGQLRGKWWELFREPELNALEDQAAASNQTVAASFANFLAARAVVKQAQAQYYPTVTANPAVTRERLSSLSTQSSPVTLTAYSLPLDAAWELDFWGRIRNTVQANQLAAQATLADLETVRLTVQAEVAADYFQLRIQDAQQQLLDAAAVAYLDSLKLTQVRHETGIASDQDVAQAEVQLEITRAQAIDLGIQRAQLEHALATLLGKPPSTFSITPKPLTAKPVAITFGVPSQLLERRPDVAAAERRVAAANAQIGVARAAYFPTLTLDGAVGYLSSSLGHLVSGPTMVWSVGPSLSETLFDAGKRAAVTEQAWATYQGTVANYRQTVLTAFQEVEDNLATLRILSKELQEQAAAVVSSQRYLQLANDRYKFGIDSYLNVITAQTTLLSNQRTEMNLRMQQLTASVQLIKALGGGWDPAQAMKADPPAARRPAGN
jgi:NodT family efflux transporter outer membrane factor (OMF) lipoprotein